MALSDFGQYEMTPRGTTNIKVSSDRLLAHSVFCYQQQIDNKSIILLCSKYYDYEIVHYFPNSNYVINIIVSINTTYVLIMRNHNQSYSKKL